jgi:hypothetical protein
MILKLGIFNPHFEDEETEVPNCYILLSFGILHKDCVLAASLDKEAFFLLHNHTVSQWLPPYPMGKADPII